MTEHEHEWRRYVLVQPGLFSQDEKKEYTEKPAKDVPGAWYVGYDCECGEEGYQA